MYYAQQQQFPPQRFQPAPQQQQQQQQPMRFGLNATVEVQWSPGMWVAARVTQNNADGTYDTLMQNGRTWFSVAVRDIRPMQSAAYAEAQQPVSASDVHVLHGQAQMQAGELHTSQAQAEQHLMGQQNQGFHPQAEAANLAPMQADGQPKTRKRRKKKPDQAEMGRVMEAIEQVMGSVAQVDSHVTKQGERSAAALSEAPTSISAAINSQMPGVVNEAVTSAFRIEDLADLICQKLQENMDKNHLEVVKHVTDTIEETHLKVVEHVSKEVEKLPQVPEKLPETILDEVWGEIPNPALESQKLLAKSPSTHTNSTLKRQQSQAPEHLQAPTLDGKSERTQAPVKPQWHASAGSLLLTLLFFGVGVAYGMWRRGWTFSDSLYFTVVTLCTVGYGDLSADTQEHKLFLCFFVTFGVVFISNTVQELVEDVGDKLREEFVDALDGDVDEKAHEENMRQVYEYKAHVHIFCLCVVVFGGAAFFKFVEKYEHEDGTTTDWSYIDGLYWAVCTLTTVGYGDMTLTKWYSRVFTIFYILFGLAVFAATFNSVAAVKAKRNFRRKRANMQQLHLTPELIRKMDTDANGVSSGEFLMFCLAELKVVAKADCKPFLEKFAELDRDASGVLDHADMQQIEKTLMESESVKNHNHHLTLGGHNKHSVHPHGQISPEP